jgi:dipeptidyl aminopeptidase/acylaminoacyl peptidase
MPQNMLGASAGLARELEARQLDARRGGAAAAGALGASDVYVMDASGGSPSNLTRDGRSSSPAWSLDGGRIVFVRHGDGGAAELWVMNADGSQPRPALSQPLAVHDPSQLALLADGRVLFTAAVKNAGQSLSQALAGATPADLHVATLGGEARRLENRHPFKQRFSVSPDGRFVAYEAVNEKGKGEIWLLEP